jgi:hypothetical protein
MEPGCPPDEADAFKPTAARRTRDRSGAAVSNGIEAEVAIGRIDHGSTSSGDRRAGSVAGLQPAFTG